MNFTKRQWDITKNISMAAVIIIGIGLIIGGSILESMANVNLFDSPIKYYTLLPACLIVLAFCPLFFFSSHRAWQLTSEEEREQIREANRIEKKKSKKQERATLLFAGLMTLSVCVFSGSALLHNQLAVWFSPQIAKMLVQGSLAMFLILGSVGGAVFLAAILFIVAKWMLSRFMIRLRHAK